MEPSTIVLWNVDPLHDSSRLQPAGSDRVEDVLKNGQTAATSEVFVGGYLS